MAHLGLSDPWGTASAKVTALIPRGERQLTDRVKVVLVTEHHKSLLAQCIDILTQAECGSTKTAGDPLLHWAYCGAEGVCDQLAHEDAPSQHRLAWFRWMAVYTVYFGVSRKGTYALVDIASNRAVSAAVTCPPRTVSFSKSYEEMGINIRRAGMQMGQEILCNNLRQKTLSQWMAEAEQQCHPLLNRGNYFYVSMFATHPDYQNQGCGSCLLSFLGDVADADGVPSYLETAGLRNVTFYTKKGGYQEALRTPVASFKHEGGAVAMVRPAAQGSAAASASALGRSANEYTISNRDLFYGSTR